MRITPVWLCLALCCATLCHAEESLDSIVLKLADDDFDIREKTTEQLSKCGPEYIPLLLKLADGWHNCPEIVWRLQRAAKGIFDRKVLTLDERYQLLHGYTGIVWEVEWCGWERVRQMMYRQQQQQQEEGQGQGQEEIPIDSVHVTGVFGTAPAGECIMQEDKILEVNGRTIRSLINSPTFKYGLFAPDTKYTLKIARLVCNKDKDGAILSYEEQTLTVEFTSEQKSDDSIDKDEVANLTKELWENYLTNFKATH